MSELQTLLIGFSNKAKRHDQLRMKFRRFVEILESQVNQPNFEIKGMKVLAAPDSDWFIATFLGRTFRFDFESVLVQKSVLQGKVTCHLVTDFPLAKAVFVDDFSFDVDGFTGVDHPDPDFAGDKLVVDDDLHGPYLFRKCLARGLQIACKPTTVEQEPSS